jgi:acyl-[acyl-carrier-protein]-phospholipid O-acyltransferase / long-chain-fatty-acid--[acyl-carrier-protein] ligase
VPDPKRGERIIVLYLATPGLSIPEVLKCLGEKRFPNLWIPDERDFHEVPELPTLGSGKLDLKRLKDMALAIVKPGNGHGT